MNRSHNMWGGRFAESTDMFVQRFTASVMFDKRLYAYDIEGSIAHATMLARCNIITTQEEHLLVDGLQQIKQEIEADQFVWDIALEDVHMNIEYRLTQLLGDVGKKLHTGRSRNDQVATDMRLFVRDMIATILSHIRELQQLIVMRAEDCIEVIMPGMTHLQFAQPVHFSHHLLAWCNMLERDATRFIHAKDALNTCPLGSAALAGTSFAIDRHLTATLLNFDTPSTNSLDSVSDRDFIGDFLYAAAQLLTHISRWAEEMIIWSSTPFSWIVLPDSLCTGSSIMPQKKNPDVPELLRGKSARVYGHLLAMLTLMKAQPLAYNKDNQEDKELLFDAVDTVIDCLQASNVLINGMEPNSAKMYADSSIGYTTATDLADYLVGIGVTFRDAHTLTGKIVQYAEQHQITLDQLPLQTLQSICPLITEAVYPLLKPTGSVALRSHIGGTARLAVEAQIAIFKERFATFIAPDATSKCSQH